MRHISILLLAASILTQVACAVGPDPTPATPNEDQDMGGSDLGEASDMPIVFPDFPQEDMGNNPPGDMSMPPGQDMPPSPEDMQPDMTIEPGDYPKPLEVSAGDGKDKVLLRGLVLTPEGPLEDGEVLIENTFITCVGTSCAGRPEASGATIIETHGIISPGLIDSHNHLPYNFLKEWVPPNNQLYTNRYQWADEPSYEEFVRPLTAHRSTNTHFCPAARWGELRSLLHGTTTMMGQSFERSCTKGGVRNADHSHDLQYDHMRTSIGSVRDINTSDAQGYIDSFDDPTEPVTRFAVHMQEGYEGDNIDKEFESFAGRDDRSNVERHQGLSLLYKETAVLIHSVSLTAAQFDEVKQTNSKIVWSPSSNMVLYGRTTDIEKILDMGITVGLGPDWTISGEDNMLGEMQFARQWASENGVSSVTPQVLWEMATSQGAEVVGLEQHVGVLREGMTADIVVFTRKSEGQDPYTQLLQSNADEIRLVLIDGEAYYGEAKLKAPLARRDDCEDYNVCGASKFLCVRHDNSDDFTSSSMIEGLLIDILEGNGYPADEQYGRGQDLLPLVDCSR
ncbi:MAG: amidohydrolase family protein [Myxococcota bacterium]|nr:amidohydrolase family protein [Myxococcota bacterium]